MLLFTEIIYSLRYNTLIDNWKLRCVADNTYDFELNIMYNKSYTQLIPGYKQC